MTDNEIDDLNEEPILDNNGLAIDTTVEPVTVDEPVTEAVEEPISELEDPEPVASVEPVTESIPSESIEPITESDNIMDTPIDVIEESLEPSPTEIDPTSNDIDITLTDTQVELVPVAPTPMLDDDLPSPIVTDEELSIPPIESIPPPLPERHESFSSIKTDQSNSNKSFKSWFNIKLTNNSKEELSDSVTELLNHDENYDFIVNRLHHNDAKIKSRSSHDKEMYIAGKTSLRNTFNEIKQGVQGAANEDEIMSKIDWEYWSKVVNNYSGIVTNDSENLLKQISNGIPEELRGMIWQLIANSKSSSLEEFFQSLKSESSDYERAIKRDLSRTRFMNNERVKDKLDEVYNIIKLYSIYDSEVGYTQGMAFITVPLLMNMSESESFCLLVTLMKNYDFRSMYLPEMPGLVLKLYQFDRLLEDLSPKLYNHLIRQGIRSSMYATQWFLTIFGYKFPLEIVLRIFDLIISQGLDIILKFAINLMIKNESHLINLKFDDLLKYLKDNLFYYYLKDENSELKIEYFKLDELVKDSMSINILPITLVKYEQEFSEIHKLEMERDEEIENLRNKNGLLTKNIRKLEKSYSLLNKEHVEIANEMVMGKVKIANLEDENRQLREKISELKTQIKSEDDSQELQKDIDLEITKTMQRNSEVMEMNRLLEEQLLNLEHNYDKLNSEFKSLSNDHINLKSRLRNLMG